jgi:hypothetical protein
MSLMPIRLEQVSTSVGQDNRSVVGAECRRAQQTLLFEVALGSTGVLPAIVQIALGHDAKGTDGGEHAAFSAVNLVHAIAFSDWLALTPPGQVQVPREHIARIAIGIAVLPTCAASTAEVVIPSVTIALTVADIVPIPHVVVSTSCRPSLRIQSRADRFAEYEEQRKSTATNRWFASVSVRRCRTSCSVPNSALLILRYVESEHRHHSQRDGR